MGLRTIKNGKRVLGILFGIMTLVEGLFAIYIAKPTTIKGIGGITQSTFVLAGVQLAILGAVMIVAWILYKEKLEGKLGKIVPILMVLASVVMILEGIAAAFLSGDIMIGKTQGISKKYIALAGAQLFVIGMVQFSLWVRREKTQRNWLFEWGAIVLTIILLGEAVVVMGVSADTTIKGIGTILKGTVFLVGLQLFLLSAALLVMQLFREKDLFANRLGKKRMSVIFTLLTFVIVLEGLVMAYYVEPVTITYQNSLKDGFGTLFVSLAAAQLMAVALLMFSFWKLTAEKLERKTWIEFLGMGLGVVLATEGAWVLGIAGNTKIANELGGITARTVMIAGFMLVVLGMIILFTWHYKENRIVKGITGKGRIDVLMIAVGLVTGLAGVVLSANIVIQGFGGVSAKYIELAGIQLVLLASIAVLMWAMRIGGISQRMKRLSYMVALFMMLLIPPAIMM